MSAPPDYVIDSAREAASRSPCAKSKRGVVAMIVADQGVRIRPIVAARGFNSQPAPFVCGSSDACRAACAKLCIHAEQRAIMNALRAWPGHERNIELVHVKVVNGIVVPGGGPACWQCSRLVVEVGLRGVWLFETQSFGMEGVTEGWHFYAAADFHRETLRACGIEVAP